MPEATINGVRLHYEISGEGKDIVFLHGYVGDIEDWRDQLGFFSGRNRVAALDQRGRGKSAAPNREEDYSVDIFVDDVFQWLKLLEIDKCCLVGHSLGGKVAINFALEHPEMLAGLVLVDATSEKTVMSPEATALIEETFRLARSQGTGAAFAYNLGNNPATRTRFRNHPETLERMRHKTILTSVAGYIYCRKASLKKESVTSRLPEIKIPTLIVYGGDDLPFISAAKTLNEGIAGSELVEIEGVGHGPQYEAPDRFNETLTSFLSRLDW